MQICVCSYKVYIFEFIVIIYCIYYCAFAIPSHYVYALILHQIRYFLAGRTQMLMKKSTFHFLCVHFLLLFVATVLFSYLLLLWRGEKAWGFHICEF